LSTPVWGTASILPPADKEPVSVARSLTYASERVTGDFTISEDGDEFEKGWWPQWTREYFPSYEGFWVRRIVPLTYRVKERRNIRFQTSAELMAAGFTDEDVTVAQLHYTLLMHLGRVFELLDAAEAFTVRSHMANRPFGRHEFFESFARLSGASDVADELLARRATPGKYEAWNESHGRDARGAWRRKNPDPLRPVRAYRNRLVHGRVVPEVYVPARDAQGRAFGDLFFYPRLKKVESYLDWRVAFAAVGGAAMPSPDFTEAALIALDAWERSVGYVEHAWQTHLFS
jgi:hypothetical protein